MEEKPVESEEHIIFNRLGPIVTVTLNNTKQLNAITSEMVQALKNELPKWADVNVAIF